MVNKLIYFLAAFTIVIALASALTNVTIKTVPSTSVTVYVTNLDKTKELGAFQGNVSSDGIISFELNTIERYVVVAVTVRLNGKIMRFKEFSDYDTTNPVLLDLTESASTGTANTTQENITTQGNLTENTTEVNVTQENTTEVAVSGNITSTPGENVKVTGLTTSNNETKFPKTVYIIIGIVIVAGIIVFIVGKRMIIGGNFFRKEQARPSLVYKSSGELTEDKKYAAIESKVKTLQNELIKLKNEDRIKQMEKKIEDDKKELEKLKKGE